MFAANIFDWLQQQFGAEPPCCVQVTATTKAATTTMRYSAVIVTKYISLRGRTLKERNTSTTSAQSFSVTESTTTLPATTFDSFAPTGSQKLNTPSEPEKTSAAVSFEHSSASTQSNTTEDQQFNITAKYANNFTTADAEHSTRSTEPTPTATVEYQRRLNATTERIVESYNISESSNLTYPSKSPAISDDSWTCYEPTLFCYKV